LPANSPADKIHMDLTAFVGVGAGAVIALIAAMI
jgi:hypothetical protein